MIYTTVSARNSLTLKIGLDTLLDHHSDAPSLGSREGLMAVQDAAGNHREPCAIWLMTFAPLFWTSSGWCRPCRNIATTIRHAMESRWNSFTAGMDDLDLDFDTRIALYRLVQESLNNVKKHAAASRVVIRLVASFPSIILRIEDNGKGFDVSDRMNAGRDERCMGLQGMQERVALLGG